MMKKITLIFTLLTVSLGYSQSLPFNFDNPVQLMVGQEGTVATIIDDAGNNVMAVVGGTTDWDHVGITFATRVDLSNSADNTIAFRVKPTTDLGTRTHLLKFEGGLNGAATNEVFFETSGTDWIEISLDFDDGNNGNPGDYGSMFIFTDAGGGALTGTYLFDDIEFGEDSGSLPADFVLPVDFSDTFNHVMNGGDGAGVNIIADPDDATNNVLEIVGTGAEWDNAQVNFTTPLDLSDDANNTMRLRMRSTTAGAGEVNEHLLKFEVGTPDNQELTFTTTGQDWTDVEVDYGAGLGSYGRMVIMVDWGGGPSTAVAGTYLVDDISVGPTVLSVDDFTTSEFRVFPNPTNGNWNLTGNSVINKVLVYDILGKQVISLEPNSSEILINSSSLNSGIYIAKIEGLNGSKTLKLVKN